MTEDERKMTEENPYFCRITLEFTLEELAVFAVALPAAGEIIAEQQGTAVIRALGSIIDKVARAVRSSKLETRSSKPEKHETPRGD